MEKCGTKINDHKWIKAKCEVLLNIYHNESSTANSPEELEVHRSCQVAD